MGTGKRDRLRADHQVPGRRPGSPGNERLTAMTGAFVLVLFIAESLTLLRAGTLLTLRVSPGMLLIGPDPPPVFPGLARRRHHRPGLVGPQAPGVIWPGVPCHKHHGSFGVKDLEGRACGCPWTWRGSGAGG